MRSIVPLKTFASRAGLLLFLVFFSSAVNIPLFAQERSGVETKLITGQVLDENGLGLAGAGISVKNTNTGVVTDAEGNFKIQIQDGNTLLLVQSIGYETQEVKATAAPLIIQMRVQARALNETVVIAYGVNRNRNDLAYSAQKISGDNLTATRESNFINSLSGKIAGLDIKRNNNLGGSTNVVLRGIKSLDGNNQALFVVDGVPVDNSTTNSFLQQIGSLGYDYGNAAADINADMIESVTVLKGAAATALYGSRAANGVIMINTKKSNRQGFGVTVNTGMTTGSIDKSTWIKYQKQYGGGYGPYYESPDGYFFYRDLLGNGTSELVVPTSEDASFGARFDEDLMVYDWKSLDPNSPYYHKKTKWVAAQNDPTSFFVKPFGSSINVLLSGANEQGGFSAGYTRTLDKGIVENSSVTKDLLNVNGNHMLGKRLRLSASLNVSNVTGKGRYETGYNGSYATGFRQWWQMNVDMKELKDAYFQARPNNFNATWNYLDPDYLVPAYWNNPYWKVYENYETDNRLRYFGNITLNYTVSDWFDILGRVGMDAYNEQHDERTAIGSIETPSYARYNRRYNELNYDLIGNFHKELSSRFAIAGLLGTNIRRTHDESILAKTNGGLVIPRFYALSNSVNPILAPEEIDESTGINGVFASINLNYNSLLLLDLTGRRDVSSTLPESNNTYYYPSASVGFVFSKLLPANNLLSFGKARLNYAEAGNTAPAHSVVDVKYPQTPFNGQAVYQQGFTKNNPNLRPERTKSVEAGLEMAFWQNRAGIDFTYYNTHSIDQILRIPVSTATGFTDEYINAGDIANKGIEISMYATLIKTRDFSWTVNLNYARNRNKIVSLAGIENILIANWGPSLNAARGEAYGTLRGTDYVYDDHGNRMVDETGHYMVTPTSNNIIGNINPDWTGGVSNTLRYKALSLGVLIDIKKGGDVFSIDRYFGLSTGLPAETAGNNDLGNPMRNDPNDPEHPGGVILPGVKEDGSSNDIRIPVEYGTFGTDYNPDRAFVYDASYVKLRELNLGYTIPAKWLKHIRYVKGADISLFGRNLWIIHKNLPDADPEDGFSAGNKQGFQAGSYPTSKIYGFNLKLNF